MLDACSCSGRAAVAKSTKRILTSSHFYSAAAEQRRDFTLPCVHPRAGRQCIALTKRKACRASLLSRWAKRVTRRRCLEQPDEHTGRRAKRKKARLAASCRAARAAWDTIFRFTCCLLRVPRSSRAAPHFLLVPSAGPSDLLPGTGKHLRYRTYRHYAIDQSVKRGMAPKRGTAPPFRTQFSRRGRRRRPRTPARRFFPRARAPRARRVSVLGP